MRHVVTLTFAAGLLLASAPGRAADPTTADCLAASDASLKAGNQHRLRAERAQLLVCAVATCPADIRKECVSRVDEVNQQIPTIIFAAKDAAGNDLSAVKVTMDGEVLSERLEGTALSIDPGQHTFTFETAGQPPLTKAFLIQEAQKDRREVVTFGGGEAAPVPLPATPTAAQPAEQPPQRHGLGGQKIAALVVGGVGVVGLAVGGIFGAMAMSKQSEAQSVCPNQCATADGVTKWSDTASAGNVSTIAFIVGGVAVAGAAVLWLTAPIAGGGGSTQVGIGPGGLQMRGTW